MNRLTYKLDEPIKTKYLNYEYMRIPDHDIMRGNLGRISDDMIFNKLGKLEDIEEEIGIDLITLFKALNGFYIPDYGYVSNNDDFIYLRKDGKGYYLKVVIHPSKPTPPHFYGYCDIHYLKDHGKRWALTKEELENGL